MLQKVGKLYIFKKLENCMFQKIGKLYVFKFLNPYVFIRPWRHAKKVSR